MAFLKVFSSKNNWKIVFFLFKYLDLDFLVIEKQNSRQHVTHFKKIIVDGELFVFKGKNRCWIGHFD
jgi:hypothetical protein